MPEAPLAGSCSKAGRITVQASRLVPVGIFIAVPAVLVVSALGPGRFLYGIDLAETFYHLRGAVGRALASGTLPVWDSHTRCGAPLLAAMQAGVLYPPTWLAILVPPGPFWALTVMLHLSLSGVFAYAWLRRGLGLRWGAALTGALVYMLSGFIIPRIFAGHLPPLCSYPWVAALLWRLERFLSVPTIRRGLWLGSCVALMILAGFPQYVMMAGMVLGAHLVWYVGGQREGSRARLARALGAGASVALGALIAAPQLLPTMELLGQVQRTAINTYTFATSYSMAPENLISFLVPTFLGDDRAVPYWGTANSWELCGFVGISALALAALGLGGKHRQRFLWMAVALAGVVFALGSHSPIYRIVYELVPGASLFRAPGRYLLLFTVAMTALTGLGVERLEAVEDSSRRHALWVGAGCATLLLAAAGAWGALRSPERWKSLLQTEEVRVRDQRMDPFPSGPGFEEAAHRGALRGLEWAALCLALMAGALLVHGRRPSARPWCAGVMGLLLGTELVVFGARYFSGYPLEGMEWPAEFVANVEHHPAHPFRIATVDESQTSTFGKCQLAGLDHVGGYDPMMLQRYCELTNLARGRPVGALVVQMHAARPGPIFDLLGARYWILPLPAHVPAGWREVGRVGSSYVYENPRSLPRAFLVGSSRILGSAPERLAFLASRAFDPRDVVVLESGLPESFPSVPGQEGTVRLVGRSDGRYELETDRPTASFLVLAESDYPGWTARVDGRPAEVLRADHLVQAVRLPAGRHRVIFSYRSNYLLAGFVLSGLAFMIPLLVDRVLRWRRPSVLPL